MTSYSVDTNPRPKVYFWLAVCSVFSALSLSNVDWISNYYGGTITSASAFAVILLLFDRWIWKWPFVNSLCGIPCLDGEWEGFITLTSQTSALRIPITVRISQWFSVIDLVFNSENIKSTARLVGLTVKNPDNIRVTWVYSCERKHGNVSSEIEDEGITDLWVVKDGYDERLQGTFYSKNRHTGDLVVTKKKTGLFI